VALAAQHFLQAGQPFPSIPGVLASLGATTCADRVYLAQNYYESGRLLARQQYEWTAPGVAPLVKHPHRQELVFSECGLEHWVAQLGAGQTLVCRVQDCYPAERAFLETWNIHTFLLVPIFVRADWWGALGFDNYPLPDPAITPQDQSAVFLLEFDALQTAANIIGAALENAQLYTEAQKRAQQLASLHEVGHAIGGTLSLDEIAKLAGESTCTLFQASAGTIYLADLIADSAHLLATVGLSTSAASQGVGLSLQDSLVGQVILTGRPLFIEQALPTKSAVETFRHAQVQSAALIPLAVSEHVLGTLNLAFTFLRRFSIDEQTLLLAIGRQIGMALANARLFQEIQAAEQATRRQTKQLIALHEVARIVNAGHNLNHTLNLLLEQLTRLVSYDSAAVFLRAGDHFTVAAGRGFPNLKAVLQLEIQYDHDAFLQTIVETQKPVVLYDAHQDRRFRGWANAHYVRGWIGSPLLVGSELVGILSVDSRQPGAFDDESAAIIQALADQVAVVIHKARLLDELQRANLELRHLDELKDQFIQNVAHELRTPLTLVRGYVELLTDEDLDKTTKNQAIRTAFNHTTTLVQLVEGITTLQDLNLDEMKPDPIQLHNLVETVMQVVHQKATRAQIHLYTDYSHDLPPLRGDFVWLAQALYQLLDNAIKFSPDGGDVTLRLFTDWDARELQIEVEDQGIGVAPEEQQRIFELFYQADGSTTRRFGGTGLGLAIARRVIQRHAGRMWVESPVQTADDKRGPGSKFIIRLPYCVDDELSFRS
jgi:signal transduction histidine kinase